MPHPDSTSWDNSAGWYNRIVGQRGHYYHQHVILPQLLPLLDLKPDSKILDVGCGQGVLARALPAEVTYVGVDNAAHLINSAKKADRNPRHSYEIGDATRSLPVTAHSFTHAVALLSLQNMEYPETVIRHVATALKPSGKFIMVLNHPSFRIPRQSGWGESENKLQYRYVNRYLSPLKIPISTHPGERRSANTWTFHQPLSAYSQFLAAHGFVIERLEEWTSDKHSVGKAAKKENRAREEIPLFMTIVATLHTSRPHTD